MQKNISIKDMLKISIDDLYEWYSENFILEIPDVKDLNTQADLINHMLTHFANSFVYFDCMASVFESMVREKKHIKAASDETMQLISKRDALIHFADQMKFCYTALSRSCTIRVESNKELQMLNHS